MPVSEPLALSYPTIWIDLGMAVFISRSGVVGVVIRLKTKRQDRVATRVQRLASPIGNAVMIAALGLAHQRENAVHYAKQRGAQGAASGKILASTSSHRKPINLRPH